MLQSSAGVKLVAHGLRDEKKERGAVQWKKKTEKVVK